MIKHDKGIVKDLFDIYYCYLAWAAGMPGIRGVWAAEHDAASAQNREWVIHRLEELVPNTGWGPRKDVLDLLNGRGISFVNCWIDEGGRLKDADAAVANELADAKLLAFVEEHT